MASSEPKESPANNPGLHTARDEATNGYFMQQTVSSFYSFYINSSWTFFQLIINMGLFIYLLSVLGLCVCFFLIYTYQLLQMFRIKDPKVSLDFYSRVLGMS